MSAARDHRPSRAILVVEDDEDQLNIRTLLLSRFGFEILPATHPRQALALARSRHPQCALIDLRLPTVEDGLALISELKQWDSLIRIILLTGSQLPDAQELQLVDAVFHKPVASRDLIEKLQSAVNAT